MRILPIGATGTIGAAVAAALAGRHDVARASRQTADEQVDIADPASIRALFRRVGRVDGIVSARGPGHLAVVHDLMQLRVHTAARSAAVANRPCDVANGA
jgi:dTDP-4-dehydrorhamnose reductase